MLPKLVLVLSAAEHCSPLGKTAFWTSTRRELGTSDSPRASMRDRNIRTVSSPNMTELSHKRSVSSIIQRLIWPPSPQGAPYTEVTSKRSSISRFSTMYTSFDVICRIPATVVSSRWIISSGYVEGEHASFK